MCDLATLFIVVVVEKSVRVALYNGGERVGYRTRRSEQGQGVCFKVDNR